MLFKLLYELAELKQSIIGNSNQTAAIPGLAALGAVTTLILTIKLLLKR